MADAGGPKAPESFLGLSAGGPLADAVGECHSCILHTAFLTSNLQLTTVFTERFLSLYQTPGVLCIILVFLSTLIIVVVIRAFDSVVCLGIHEAWSWKNGLSASIHHNKPSMCTIKQTVRARCHFFLSLRHFWWHWRRLLQGLLARVMMIYDVLWWALVPPQGALLLCMYIVILGSCHLGE